MDKYMEYLTPHELEILSALRAGQQEEEVFDPDEDTSPMINHGDHVQQAHTINNYYGSQKNASAPRENIVDVSALSIEEQKELTGDNSIYVGLHHINGVLFDFGNETTDDEPIEQPTKTHGIFYLLWNMIFGKSASQSVPKLSQKQETHEVIDTEIIEDSKPISFNQKMLEHEKEMLKIEKEREELKLMSLAREKVWNDVFDPDEDEYEPLNEYDKQFHQLIQRRA